MRHRIKGFLLGEDKLALKSGHVDLVRHFEDIDNLGLYLHVPFCRQICPYCPYNKELFHLNLAEHYAEAVLQEIEQYSALIGHLPVTSFYIGGGTPTTMLHAGLPKIIETVYQRFNMQCSIHLESHPDDLSPENLDTIRAMGVEHLSIGIEALQDHHLRTLRRPYTAAEAQAAIARAVAGHFKCVNVDLIFALPNQTHQELDLSSRLLVELGIDQIAAYPLFSFVYTLWPQLAHHNRYRSYSLLEKRRMLQVVERVFYSAGYTRTSVWAFTKADSPRYCSVTVPLYLGLGASAGSYLRDIFYLNTFNTAAYIRALADGSTPIALSLELSERMQMAGWLYWRIYETRFHKNDFERRFGQRLETVYGKYLRLLSLLGLLTEAEDEVVLSDAGAFWLHAIQDLFSVDYVGKLWGISRQNPWPSEVYL